LDLGSAYVAGLVMLIGGRDNLPPFAIQ
jgi:hypothetical protein